MSVLHRHDDVKTKTPRLNLNLSARSRAEVDALAADMEKSFTELVRLGLSILKVVYEEHRRGNRIVVTTAEGKPLKELVIPSI